MRQAQLARGVVKSREIPLVPSDIPFSDPVPRGGSLRIPKFGLALIGVQGVDSGGLVFARRMPTENDGGITCESLDGT